MNSNTRKWRLDTLFTENGEKNMTAIVRSLIASDKIKRQKSDNRNEKQFYWHGAEVITKTECNFEFEMANYATYILV